MSRLSALLSLTAADALGAATEFKTPAEIGRRYGPITSYQPGSPFGFAPGEATDDSQMTVATLLGYVSGRGLNGVLAALVDWLNARPPDVGGLTRSALHYGTPDGGVRAWEASRYQGAGNGGLMRIAAVWLAGFQAEALLREAVTVTALTHADPRCVHASVFLVAFLEQLEGGVEYDLAAQAALDAMQALDARQVLLRAELLHAGVPEANHAFSQADAAARLAVQTAVQQGLAGQVKSQSGYVLGTLQAAVAYGRGADWLACVQPAVMGGDDSDTVACVTGAIAGARGLTVPEHLLGPLRLGHSWSGWVRAWSCLNRFPGVLSDAQRTNGEQPDVLPKR